MPNTSHLNFPSILFLSVFQAFLKGKFSEFREIPMTKFYSAIWMLQGIWDMLINSNLLQNNMEAAESFVLDAQKPVFFIGENIHKKYKNRKCIALKSTFFIS